MKRSYPLAALAGLCLLVGLAAPVRAQNSVRATLNVEGCTNRGLSFQVTYVFRPIPSGTTFTRTQNNGPFDNIILENVPSGTYNLAIKTPRHLRKTIRVTLQGGEKQLGEVALRAGDIDNNNVVDLDDLGILALAFNTGPGDPHYNANADVDYSGYVDLDDLGWMALHFNEAGDP